MRPLFGEPQLVTSIDDIIDNQKYGIDHYVEALKQRNTWSQLEYTAMGDETIKAIKNALTEHSNSSVEIFQHRTVQNSKGKHLMEWDGVLTSDNYVFLCFAKHKITEVSIYFVCFCYWRAIFIKEIFFSNMYTISFKDCRFFIRQLRRLTITISNRY